jgi:hypothetical protein
MAARADNRMITCPALDVEHVGALPCSEPSVLVTSQVRPGAAISIAQNGIAPAGLSIAV